jgi:hypothetical protein
MFRLRLKKGVAAMKKFTTVLIGTIMCLALPLVALAVPTLQLDVEGGEYDWGVESVVTGDGVFTVDAILTPGKIPLEWFLDQTFYLSIAVSPRMDYSVDGADLGSFTVNGGDPIDVTSDMIYGNPPIENAELIQPADGGDLGPHDVFPTYFVEVPFQFDTSHTTATYNTQDEAGGVKEGTGSYYIPFEIDMTGLNQEYGLHFDLYNESLKKGDYDIAEFAPFSHDAETHRVPEPGVLPLLAMGLLGMGLASRKLR